MEGSLNETYNMGIVKISDDVVSVIAGLAAAEIKGTAGVNTGLAGGITQILGGKKNVSKGVKVTMNEQGAAIEISMAVEYGLKIQEIARAVQENVKKAVETMTGLTVSTVNILVQNIIVPKNDAVSDIDEE
ncbi:Asp23/Gls24 family envelope stress response protein [Clostridium oryzae]|uniref:Asp23/Gls24 family envelope stress response protein n=1 Tax=Clostridium oryzae TaxID=1450648 RepID=UPI0009A4CF55